MWTVNVKNSTGEWQSFQFSDYKEATRTFYSPEWKKAEMYHEKSCCDSSKEQLVSL